METTGNPQKGPWCLMANSMVSGDVLNQPVEAGHLHLQFSFDKNSSLIHFKFAHSQMFNAHLSEPIFIFVFHLFAGFLSHFRPLKTSNWGRAVPKTTENKLE
jgi:hypothetical protein